MRNGYFLGLKARFKIGVGRAHWFGLPLPPNRTGGFPAYGFPEGGSPRQGLTSEIMGDFQAV